MLKKKKNLNEFFPSPRQKLQGLQLVYLSFSDEPLENEVKVAKIEIRCIE